MIEEHQIDDLLDELRRLPGYEKAVLAEPLRAMPGGFWATIFELRLDGVLDQATDLVLRVMPDDDAAVKETVIQRAVAAQGYPAPAVRLAGGRELGLGGPFMVMDRAPGRMLLADLNGVGAIRSLPTVLRRMPARLAEAMAALHRLDPEPVRAELDRRRSTASADVDHVLTWLTRGAELSSDSTLHRAARWLRDRQPPPGTEVICHGDLHPFNVLADGDEWRVLDWTGAVIARPEYDVAYTALLLGHPPLDAPAPLRPLIRAGGRAVVHRFRTEYSARADLAVDPDALQWFTTLHAFRIAIELDGWRREGSLDEQQGSPWIALEPAMRRHLAAISG
jgi:aminoglycoside phosphotransferase (APT) family kinase protein